MCKKHKKHKTTQIHKAKNVTVGFELNSKARRQHILSRISVVTCVFLCNKQ